MQCQVSHKIDEQVLIHVLIIRFTDQNFEELHSQIKRGDIIGITGFPGN